ncbi:MAG: adenosylcobinamide-GDP ribazoletransferase [Bilophila wadsworthia]
MKFRAALGFFTRLPVGSAPLPPTFQGVIVWLPAIGLIVGLLAALAVALATLFCRPARRVIGCLVWSS